MTLPPLSWQHVVAILILSALVFTLAWKAPLVLVLSLWGLREAFAKKINRMLK